MHDDLRSVAASWWKSADEIVSERCCPFEAGVAELYDYSHLGHDPLKGLVVGLDLETVPMIGRTVILDEKIITNPAALKQHFGKKAEVEASKFYRSCAELYSPNEYYLEDWQVDNKHPWFDPLFSEVLDEIKDPTARKYVAVSSRSGHRDRTTSDVGAQRS